MVTIFILNATRRNLVGKPNDKQLLKRKEQIENEISKLEVHISILERERREIINHLDLNKQNVHEQI